MNTGSKDKVIKHSNNNLTTSLGGTSRYLSTNLEKYQKTNDVLSTI